MLKFGLVHAEAALESLDLLRVVADLVVEIGLLSSSGASHLGVEIVNLGGELSDLALDAADFLSLLRND